MTASILVVDDEVRSLESLRRTLEEEFIVFTAPGAAEAFEIMSHETVDIVLTDQRMPDMSGVAFLKRVRELWPDSVRIIISGYTDSEEIIAGINEAGIYQYLLKPWHPDQLLLTLRRAAELQALQAENCRLNLDLRAAEPTLRGRVEAKQHQIRQLFGLENIVRAAGSPMEQVCEMVARAAQFDVPVLLQGESGTGKELLARAVHYAGTRADKPFVVENCGALSDTLLESELFGHKRGAFTGATEDRDGLFQQADGGTLFLDEIGETSTAFQVKLLRVLQEGEFRPLGSNRRIAVDVRVVAATNRRLEDEVGAGRFREDLYYRLATVPIDIPPLRERRMDIPVLANSLLAKYSVALLGKEARFAAELLECLTTYEWPGNVRELQNEIQRMLVLSRDERLGLENLPSHIRDLPSKPAGQLRVWEAETLSEVMQRHGGNLTHAANELGLSRLGLRNKLKRLGVEAPVRGRGRPVSKVSKDG